MSPFIQHRSGAGDEETRVKQATSGDENKAFLPPPPPPLLYPGNSSVLPPAWLNTGAALIIIPTKSRCESTHLRKSSSVNYIRCSSSASSFSTLFFSHEATAIAAFAVRARLTLCPHSKHSGKSHSEVDGFSPPTITVNRYLSDCYQTAAHLRRRALKISVYSIWSGDYCVKSTINNDDESPCIFLNVPIGPTATEQIGSTDK